MTFVRTLDDLSPILETDRYRSLAVAPGEMRVEIVDIKAGPGSNRMHAHDDEDEWLICLSGAAEFRVKDELVQLRPGTILYIPAGADHASVNRSEAGVTIALYGPPAPSE